MTTVAVHDLKIERIVTSSFRSVRARFVYLKENIDLCYAICYEIDAPVIMPNSIMLTVEQASALSIAISMAIDWIAEQQV